MSKRFFYSVNVMNERGEIVRTASGITKIEFVRSGFEDLRVRLEAGLCSNSDEIVHFVAFNPV